MEEMKAFISINILMGIHKLQVPVNYWSTNKALRILYISCKMAWNCLKAALHVSTSVWAPISTGYVSAA